MEPNTNWPETVERIRDEHNGVFAVRLYFGHDGHNACYFHDYEKITARGESGVSMQAAVEQCLARFRAQMTDKWRDNMQIIVE